MPQHIAPESVVARLYRYDLRDQFRFGVVHLGFDGSHARHHQLDGGGIDFAGQGNGRKDSILPTSFMVEQAGVNNPAMVKRAIAPK